MDCDQKKPALSFAFSKKKESSKLESSAIKDDESYLDDDKAAFVDSFDGKQLNRKEKTALVIPLITVNKWTNPCSPDELEDQSDEKEEREFTKVDGNTIESEAANELLKEAASRRGAKDAKKDSNFTVPLMELNKVPEGYETDNRLDVSLRPEGSVEADYTKVPIEEYGLGMLRGMGWKEGEGIGKKGRLTKPVEVVLRPKGLGLGADRNLAKQQKGDADGVDPEVAKLTYTRGVHCRVTNGRHKDLYGTIQGIDEDNSRVIVKMTLSSECITITQFAAQLVTKKDYNINSKVLNKAKVDKYKEEEHRKDEKHRKESLDREEKHRNEDGRRDRERDRRKDRDRDHDDHRDKNKKRKHDSSSASKCQQSAHRMWIRTHLRVRMVDPEYKQGKYFKAKMVIEDVIGPGVCICRTDDGRVLDGVQEAMLETVIPRSEPGYVMVVSGKHRGKLGEMLRKDKNSGEAVVQLLEDRDVALTSGFDDICEYTGNIDDEFSY